MFSLNLRFSNFSSDISRNHQMSSLWHDVENIRAAPSLLTRHWMWQANLVRQLAAHVLYLCTPMLGCSVGRKCLSALRRVSPRPSSFFLYFPCKVWGFSKQTGGDKHMLWTALCWVVSEVQQSRSLSGFSYTSHSGVDCRTGALLYPADDKALAGSFGESF